VELEEKREALVKEEKKARELMDEIEKWKAEAEKAKKQLVIANQKIATLTAENESLAQQYKTSCALNKKQTIELNRALEELFEIKQRRDYANIDSNLATTRRTASHPNYHKAHLVEYSESHTNLHSPSPLSTKNRPPASPSSPVSTPEKSFANVSSLDLNESDNADRSRDYSTSTVGIPDFVNEEVQLAKEVVINIAHKLLYVRSYAEGNSANNGSNLMPDYDSLNLDDLALTCDNEIEKLSIAIERLHRAAENIAAAKQQSPQAKNTNQAIRSVSPPRKTNTIPPSVQILSDVYEDVSANSIFDLSQQDGIGDSTMLYPIGDHSQSSIRADNTHSKIANRGDSLKSPQTPKRVSLSEAIAMSVVRFTFFKGFILNIIYVQV